jgi:DNA-binding transcriptional regulator YiaG
MHAREIAADLGRELTELADDSQSDRTRELRRFQMKFASFSEQPPTFARVRRPFAVPSGQDVRKLREKYQLTQADAADLVHVTPNAWQKWEQGVRRMDRRTWELLLYKLHEDYL